VNQAHRSRRLYGIAVITTPNKPIPIEATPIARSDDGSLERGHAAAISPKIRMATPVIASKSHAILKRMPSHLVIVAN